jgi:hypothetical protein
MAVNQQHVESLLRQVPDDATARTLLDRAAELTDYVNRGKTLPDPGTGENVSPETLAEVARLLQEQAAARDPGGRAGSASGPAQ